MKNMIVLLILALVAGLGVGYAVYNDPELPSILLFDQTMDEFAKKSPRLEQQFRDKGSFELSSDVMNFEFSNGKAADISNVNVSITIESNYITLTFEDGDWPFANQSIVLEPLLKENEFRWKCLSGSVLIRFRAKGCRLGYGLLLNDGRS